MIKYFSSGYTTRTLILIFMAAVMWLPAFLLPAQTIIPANPAPLLRLFLLISPDNIYIHLSLAFILTIASALLLNQIATQFGITQKIAQLGMLVYVLLTAALSAYTAMNPIILVNFLMLLLLQTLFKLSETKENIPLIFNASFTAGIIVLVYFPAVLFLPLIWAALLVFNQLKLRNLAVSLLGFTLPFVFAFTGYFWIDQAQEACVLLQSSFVLHLPNTLSFPFSDWGISLILFLFLLIALAKTNSRLMEKNIAIRQTLVVIINYLVIAFVTVLFFSIHTADSLLIAVPAAFIIAFTLSEAKNTKWYEWALRLIFLLILINQYTRLFYAA